MQSSDRSATPPKHPTGNNKSVLTPGNCLIQLFFLLIIRISNGTGIAANFGSKSNPNSPPFVSPSNWIGLMSANRKEGELEQVSKTSASLVCKPWGGRVNVLCWPTTCKFTLAFLTTFHHFKQWLLTAGNQPLRTSITGDSGCNQSQARSQKRR